MKRKNSSARNRTYNFYLKKLKDSRIKKTYQIFKKKLIDYKLNNFCVAVSGGADSIALSFLAKCYSLEKNKKVSFFIVDHKLRKNSSNEANLVKNKLKQFNINIKILTIKNFKKFSNLQSFARENRYKLLFKQCLNQNSNAVLTAHHRDDLIENFFIRLLRGSGLKGLISFKNVKSKIKFDDKIFIIRPLIDVPKKDLIYISKNTFNYFVDDPSNINDKFLRVKIRQLISKLEKEGLTFNKFDISLDNLSKSNYALDYYVQKNINDNSNYHKSCNGVILKNDFFKQPNEIVFRSFSEIMQKVGNKITYPRGAKVQNLLNTLNSKNKNIKKTLSGCIIQRFQKSVIIYREK